MVGVPHRPLLPSLPTGVPGSRDSGFGAEQVTSRHNRLQARNNCAEAGATREQEGVTGLRVSGFGVRGEQLQARGEYILS